MDGHKRYDLCEKLVNTKIADMTPEEKDNYIFEHMMDIVVEYDDDALALSCKWMGIEYEA